MHTRVALSLRYLLIPEIRASDKASMFNVRKRKRLQLGLDEAKKSESKVLLQSINLESLLQR